LVTIFVWRKENFITFATRFMQSLVGRMTDYIANNKNI